MRLGDLAKANAIKKQLPFFTLTGNYHTVRQSHSLIRYNPVITIDVDDLEDGRIEGVRQALASDPDVLAFFLTPKRHGFKIFLYLRTEYARRLRQTAFSVPVITYSELEKHHSLMYEMCIRDRTSPYQYVLSCRWKEDFLPTDRSSFYRMLSHADFYTYFARLHDAYSRFDYMEDALLNYSGTPMEKLCGFLEVSAKSPQKKLNMFLRWMICLLYTSSIVFLELPH